MVRPLLPYLFMYAKQNHRYIYMLNISINLSHVNYTMLIITKPVKDTEDWFGYGKINILCRIHALCFKF